MVTWTHNHPTMTSTWTLTACHHFAHLVPIRHALVAVALRRSRGLLLAFNTCRSLVLLLYLPFLVPTVRHPSSRNGNIYVVAESAALVSCSLYLVEIQSQLPPISRLYVPSAEKNPTTHPPPPNKNTTNQNHKYPSIPPPPTDPSVKASGNVTKKKKLDNRRTP